MTRLSRVRLALLCGLVLLGGCATERIAAKEDMLAAAGFRIRPADTPERQASLASLPPHKFIRQTRNGQPVWLYADPTICGCLYVGNSQAWQTYRANVFQQRLADEQELTATMNQNAAMDFAMWGPWW